MASSRTARLALLDADDHLEDTDYDELTKLGFLRRTIKWQEGGGMEVEFPLARYEVLKRAEGVAMEVKGKIHKGYLRGKGGFDQTTALWADHLLEQAFNEGHFFAFRANFPPSVRYPPPRSEIWPLVDRFIEHVLFPHGLYRGDRQRTEEGPANSRDIALVNPSQVHLNATLAELGKPHIFTPHHGAYAGAGMHEDSASDNEEEENHRRSRSPSQRYRSSTAEGDASSRRGSRSEQA